MTESAVTVETERFHGRNRISSKAIRSVVSAITADELGIDAQTVGVELSDNNGGLTVGVSAPVATSALATAGANRSPAAGARSNLVEQATAAQGNIRGRMLEMTGSAVGVVNIRFTTAHIKREVRVR